MTLDDHGSQHRLTGPATTLLAATAIVIGLVLILIAATLGRCDAFGGRCPAQRPSPWDDDVFGMASFGTALIMVVPAYLHRRSWRRLGVAAAVGMPTAIIVGLLVTIAAHR